MSLELLYGKGRLALNLDPAIIPHIIRKPAMPLIAEPRAAIAKALAQPHGSASLSTLAGDKQSACILICDITRPVPNGLFLGLLVDTLVAAGLELENICIVVATGLHRPNLGVELAELIGDPDVLKHIRIYNHDATNDSEHADLGSTSTGIPIKLDRRFVEAEIRIATGLVEPHFMAGYSGGRKVIAPGVAHAETITRLHSAALMAHPKAANRILEGNPLHQEQLEIVAKLGGALALNTVIDDERRLAYVNFGEIVSSHALAVNFMRQYAEIPVPRRFSTIVSSAAGYPLDKTYYQTIKAMVAPLDILNKGGDLLLASACSEGLGSAHFRSAQERLVELGVEAFAEQLGHKQHADIDEWQTQMQIKAMRQARLHLKTDGLTAKDLRLTAINPIDSLEEAINASCRRHDEHHIAVIPEGPYVIPYYVADEQAPVAPDFHV